MTTELLDQQKAKPAKRRKLPKGMAQRGDGFYSAFRAGGRLIRKQLSTDFRTACELLTNLREGRQSRLRHTGQRLPVVGIKDRFP